MGRQPRTGDTVKTVAERFLHEEADTCGAVTPFGRFRRLLRPRCKSILFPEGSAAERRQRSEAICACGRIGGAKQRKRRNRARTRFRRMQGGFRRLHREGVRSGSELRREAFGTGNCQRGRAAERNPEGVRHATVLAVFPARFIAAAGRIVAQLGMTEFLRGERAQNDVAEAGACRVGVQTADATVDPFLDGAV